MSHAWDDRAWAHFTHELDAWQASGRVASFWWRDDDAGRPHPALDRLFDLAARTDTPLAVAVVPMWLTPEGAAAVRAAPAHVVILQHGFAHANHEPAAPAGERRVRPAECGRARPASVVLAEARAGRERLADAFDARFRPVFVPPWNRIAPAVVDGLAATGHQALSALGPRPAPEAAPGVLSLNCHADPIAWHEAKRFIGAAAALARLGAHLRARREGRADPLEPTGVLTHHRDMDAAFWTFFDTLLHRLRAHPGVVFPSLDTSLSPVRS
jgi:hypothetical protein